MYYIDFSVIISRFTQKPSRAGAPKAACEVVAKLLKSAVANAENKDMDTSRLYVAECYVGQGPTLKRIRPRAQGRANRINKKTSHITLVLKEAE